VLVEFWLDGMEARAVDPASVLAAYRGLNRTLGLLNDDGTVSAETDERILATADSWEGRYVNLVLGLPNAIWST
jgi:hypothetical protein